MNEARTLAKAVACRFTLRTPRRIQRRFDPPHRTNARDPSVKDRFLAEPEGTRRGVPNTIGTSLI
jgi:hypothetical protein